MQLFGIYKKFKARFSRRNPIYVTKPFLPPLNKLYPYLKKIWKNKILTNNGPLHQEFESKLSKFLNVNEVSLCSNGTIALLLAIKSLNLKGEIITTPFSFIATANAITWNELTPVFADTEDDTPNLDPKKIEKLINKNTCAILAVHCYGIPCNIEELENIAKKYNLKLIFDAAHAFGVEINGESILGRGDLSVLSFHATKVFNTFEGGAIITNNPKNKEYIDQLKNFGILNENSIPYIGINAKMSELNAAIGLIQLDFINKIILRRKYISKLYKEKLFEIKSIKFFKIKENINYNYSYLPVIIEKNSKVTRDELFNFLKEKGIISRKYFYPLITNTKAYKNFSLEIKNDLINANRLSETILCLPIYPDLKDKEIDYICKMIKRKLD